MVCIIYQNIFPDGFLLPFLFCIIKRPTQHKRKEFPLYKHQSYRANSMLKKSVSSILPLNSLVSYQPPGCKGGSGNLVTCRRDCSWQTCSWILVGCFWSGFLCCVSDANQSSWDAHRPHGKRQAASTTQAFLGSLSACGWRVRSTAVCWVMKRKHSDKDSNLQHLLHLGNFTWLKPISQNDEGSYHFTNDC